jgi:antitoxin (DNA-binding transcriptional repressor) of toxin-antitoxin stability system
MARFEVEADPDLEALIDRIATGDEVVVVREGRPAVRLMIEAAASETAPGLAEPEQRAYEVATMPPTGERRWYDPRKVDPNTLTRDDAKVACLLPNAELRPSRAAATDEERYAQIAAIAAAASREAFLGPDAARSQDFLYDDDGLPA